MQTNLGLPNALSGFMAFYYILWRLARLAHILNRWNEESKSWGLLNQDIA